MTTLDDIRQMELDLAAARKDNETMRVQLGVQTGELDGLRVENSFLKHAHEREVIRSTSMLTILENTSSMLIAGIARMNGNAGVDRLSQRIVPSTEPPKTAAADQPQGDTGERDERHEDEHPAGDVLTGTGDDTQQEHPRDLDNTAQQPTDEHEDERLPMPAFLRKPKDGSNGNS